MSNRKKILRSYHVRFTSDFLVPAMSRQEALELAEDSMVNLIEDEEFDFGDIFAVSVESDKFHIVEDLPDDEDVCDDDDEDAEEDEEEDDGDDEDEEDDEE